MGSVGGVRWAWAERCAGGGAGGGVVMFSTCFIVEMFDEGWKSYSNIVVLHRMISIIGENVGTDVALPLLN